jgi:hypothetical protein
VWFLVHNRDIIDSKTLWEALLEWDPVWLSG